MRRSLFVLVVLAGTLLALAARTPALQGALSQAQAYLPFVARQVPPTPTATPTATPTITPTPIPPFAGVAQIQYTHNAVDGWDWPADSSVIIDVTSSEGTHKDTLALVADTNGWLPWSEFNVQISEGDWITLTLGSLQAGFPIVPLQATGDPEADTFYGTARPFARVTGLAGNEGEWYGLETTAGADGSFLLDFTSEVDWDGEDYLRVGQYLNANGKVDVTGGSPQFNILPTPIQPFGGCVGVYPFYNTVSGWGLPANAEITISATGPDCFAVDRLSVVIEENGHLPWTQFNRQIREHDWITLTLSGHQTGFPVEMLRATADPETNTIVGQARPFSRVSALVERPGNDFFNAECTANAEGAFSIDFSPQVDWQYADTLWVGQWLNENGVVYISNDSPQLRVISPFSETAGVARVWLAENAMDGWGWPAHASVSARLVARNGIEKEQKTIRAAADGSLAYSQFTHSLETNDTITLTVGQQSVAFDVRPLYALLHTDSDVLEGIAEPSARIVARVEHPPGNWTVVESFAEGDGTFLIDMSPDTDWEAGDDVHVGQYRGPHGLLQVTSDSPYTWHVEEEVHEALFRYEPWRLQRSSLAPLWMLPIAGAGDLDQDGDLDLVIAHFNWGAGWEQDQSGPVLIYDNDGRGFFTDVTDQRLLGAQVRVVGNALALADFTGDGWLDIVIACSQLHAAPHTYYRDRLLVNQGNGFFRDETEQRMPETLEGSHRVSVGDVDGDADVDIFFNFHFRPTGLLINNGEGFFTISQGGLPTDVTYDATASAFIDSDSDGDLDLFLGTSDTPSRNRLLINDGLGRFSLAPAHALPEKPGGLDDLVMMARVADFNRDGCQDIVTANTYYGYPEGEWYMPNIDEPRLNQLLISNGDGTFRDATGDWPQPFFGGRSWDIAVGDLDNDGDMDLVPANTNAFFGLTYLNDGTGEFAAAIDCVLPRVRFVASQNDVEIFDIDGDGDQDVIIFDRAGYTVYVNTLIDG